MFPQPLRGSGVGKFDAKTMNDIQPLNLDQWYEQGQEGKGPTLRGPLPKLPKRSPRPSRGEED